MSNGDDVLDNWEEIDEAGLTSSVEKLKNSSTDCERITKTSYTNSISDSGKLASSSTQVINTTSVTSNIKPTQMKLLQRSNTTQDSTSMTVLKPSSKSPLDDMSATFQPVMMVLHKPQDEYHSANYTPPISNQTVKILRRPTQSIEPRNNDIRPKLPLKTLQQREQEYAEARLRILGSAKNPEDDEQKTTPIVTPTTVQTSTINSTPSAALANNSLSNLASVNAKINLPKIQGGPIQYNNHYNQQQQYQQNYQSQQQQQQNYFYNQQPQPQSPAYTNNNNRTYGLNPLLGSGHLGAIGQTGLYQSSLQAQLPQQQHQPTQQHIKYQLFNQKPIQQLHQKSQQQQQTWSPVVGGSVSSSSLRQPPQNDTILRLPHGPDGTTGFQMRR